jgi:quinolinate synthase
MAMNNLENLETVLTTGANEIELSLALCEQAMKSLHRMLAFRDSNKGT